MTVFDLLLIVVVLVSAVALIAALVQAANGRFRSSARTLLGLACGLAVYVAAICVVSLSSTQKIKALGEPDCNDDWCITPEKAHFQGSDVTIDFKVWSRAKRVTQREFGVHPFLLDEHGRRFDIVGESGPSFDQAIAPTESFKTSRRYHCDPGAATLDLRLRSATGPGTFVIGDSASLLHPRTVYRLKPAPAPV